MFFICNICEPVVKFKAYCWSEKSIPMTINSSFFQYKMFAVRIDLVYLYTWMKINEANNYIELLQAGESVAGVLRVGT